MLLEAGRASAHGGEVRVMVGLTKGRRSSFEIVQSKSPIDLRKRQDRNRGRHTQRGGTCACNKKLSKKKKGGGEESGKGVVEGENKFLSLCIIKLCWIVNNDVWRYFVGWNLQMV